MRGRIDYLIDEEPSISLADGAWNDMHSAKVQPDETEKVAGSWQRKEENTEYQYLTRTNQACY